MLRNFRSQNFTPRFAEIAVGTHIRDQYVRARHRSLSRRQVISRCSIVPKACPESERVLSLCSLNCSTDRYATCNRRCIGGLMTAEISGNLLRANLSWLSDIFVMMRFSMSSLPVRWGHYQNRKSNGARMAGRLRGSLPVDRRLGADLHQLDDVVVGIGDERDAVVRAALARWTLRVNVHGCQVFERCIDVVDD
jgi:hypothetical protein